MEHFVRSYVSPQSCVLCVVDPKAKVDDVVAYFFDFDFPIERISLEAGSMSQHLYFR